MKRKLFKSTLNRELCLIIGMAGSPHLHSWIKGMDEAKVFRKIIIFPSDFPIIPERVWFNPNGDATTHVSVIRLLPSRILNFYFMHILELVFGNKWRSVIIWFLIKRKKPCIVHYHEMQHGGYLLNRISDKIRSLGDAKPQIIGSSWGSDLSFFGYVDSHSREIQKLLDLTLVLTAERSEEFEVLHRYNYSGMFLAPIYNSVGSQPEKNFFGPVSRLRDIILIKGYQHDQGRALNALKALESLEEAKKFKIRVFSAAKLSPVDLQSSRMKNLFGFDIEVLPRQSHIKFLDIFRESRVYIGLSESDGLSTSMVEAMATGCFPIQSGNSAAPHFIEHGVTGFVVDPWDILSIRDSIRIALTDDKLLEAAQIVNRNLITEKYNWNSGVKNLAKLYNLNSDSKDGIPGGLF